MLWICQYNSALYVKRRWTAGSKLTFMILIMTTMLTDMSAHIVIIKYLTANTAGVHSRLPSGRHGPDAPKTI
jgi:hypothetical protein